MTPYFIENLKEDLGRLKLDPVLSGMAQFFYLESLIHRAAGNRNRECPEVDVLEEIRVQP